MWNPFSNKEEKITLTAVDVVNMVGTKEAELMIARGQLQQAAQMIEQAKAKIAELEKALDAKTMPTAVK